MAVAGAGEEEGEEEGEGDSRHIGMAQLDSPEDEFFFSPPMKNVYWDRLVQLSIYLQSFHIQHQKLKLGDKPGQTLKFPNYDFKLIY